MGPEHERQVKSAESRVNGKPNIKTLSVAGDLLDAALESRRFAAVMRFNCSFSE